MNAKGSGARRAIVGSIIWLLVCFVASLVVIARLGDYGSIVQLLIGMGIGITGAISHAALSASAAFRGSGTIRRALLNWLLGYSAFLAVALFLLNPWAHAGTPEFWIEVFRFIVLYTGGPMLLLSFLVALATRR